MATLIPSSDLPARGLRLHGVHKEFAGQTVVDNLNLEIEEGSFVALLGPSGCGKTTTLRMIAGFDTLSSGRISLGSTVLASDHQQLPPELRNMSMVFQSYALWPHMTVADNVGYPLKLKGYKGSDFQRRVREALATVQMEPYAQRRPQDLSGGQRQRVALARCLASEPRVVLLDEPLANLDRHLRASMEDSFRDFHRRTGATFIYVTHDQAEAMALADRIAVMHKGQLVQWDAPEALYQRPQNAWVAGFIGQGSVVRLPLSSSERLLSSAQVQQALAALQNKPSAPEEVLIRPQHVELDPAGVPATVTHCVFKGERYQFVLQLQDGQSLQAYHWQGLPTGAQIAITVRQGWRLQEQTAGSTRPTLASVA